MYSRIAISGICIIEAEKNFLFRLIKRIACPVVEIEDQVRLTFKLASNNFACLK